MEWVRSDEPWWTCVNKMRGYVLWESNEDFFPVQMFRDGV
jgi:hypothetical protein